ncbi:hypothetical protein HOP50_10g60150 [Chloropicon primus]|uniref:Uncharacterized protein n=1 Tax=Chloropicon primus TaxID=1764295 RepID=A0A5B8MT41_9CHLO|nr:hypothetical protein A3770_10p59940 [Chloropicon primus]UPR02688.1 hypothetical protein HOP50_10g60150 [Chloropicon primus]|eukprot:QDZ23476.1 hypothetical protein A3770_10p59940 [Chloropicon primus]
MASTPAFTLGIHQTSEEDATPVQALETPNQARIKLLSARIAGVHNDREVERQLRQDSILTKLKATEDVLARTQINSEGNHKLAWDRLTKLRDGISTQVSALDALDERQAKELNLFETSHSVDVTAEREERQENELKFEKLIVDRLECIQQELVQECQRREHEEAVRVKHLQEEVGKLRAKMEAEKKRIEALDHRMLGKTADDMKKVGELLKAEIKVREETEKTMLKIIEESSNKLHIETQANKRSREETHESLIRIMEQTCQSVEQNIDKPIAG